MRLLDLSSTAARATLAAGAPVFVPVNPIEFHGPHLPLRTDGMVAAGLIRDLGGSVGPPVVPLADVAAGVLG